MLDYIRSNAQSFGVKVAFAIIILVFMFWGVGSLTDGGSSNVVAKVNGEAITAQQFEQAYQRAAEYAMRNDPSLTREALVQQKLGRQVLNELISAQLIRQEAARVGMTVSPEEMHYVVSKLPAFQDAQGKFDPEAYKRNIEAQRMSVAEYEQGLADSILRDKVMRTVAGSAWAAGDEARKYYDFLTQQRTVEYLYLPAADFAASVKPTEEELNAWYEAHKAELASQPRVEVEYVAVAPEGLVRPESVSAEAALKWYEANKQRFHQPEQVKVAHILVPLAENAPEAAVKQAMEKAVRIRSEAEKGDFAAVANANNGPNAAGPGGELGWIQRGQTVKPFEDAAWALQPGQISEPVRSQFGLHIIKMEERKDASVQPFAEVEAEVRATLAKQEGVEKVNDVLDSLIGDNINNRPLQESAARAGSYKDAGGKEQPLLKAERTGLVGQAELQKILGISDEMAASLMKAPANSPVDTALEADDRYLVVRVLTSEPSTTPSLDQARDRVMKALVAEKSLQAAMEKATAIRKAMTDGTLPAEDAARVQSADLTRDGALAGFVPNPAMNQVIFRAAPQTWIDQAFSVYEQEDSSKCGALLCRVTAVEQPKSDGWAGMENLLTELVQRKRVEGMYQTFMRMLEQKAKIEVYNSRVLESAGI